MKNILEFLKTSLSGGILVLLLMLYLLLDEIIDILIALVTPIADLFPRGLFDKVELPGLIVLVLLLGKLPIYNAVIRMSQGLIGAKEDGVFKPAVMHSENGEREIVNLIEEDSKGQVTVLVPWPPHLLPVL
jgi:hypothetical protein